MLCFALGRAGLPVALVLHLIAVPISPIAVCSVPLPPAPPNRPAINEFVPDPSAGADWIELYNPTAEAIALAGWYLDDNPAASDPLRLPDDALLPAHGFAVFELGAALNKGGDQVRLLDPAGTVVEAVAYVAAEPDTVFARRPDGAGEFHRFTSATRGAANAPALAINELAPLPAAGDMGWIELYNAGSAPLDITGLRIVFEHDGTTQELLIADDQQGNTVEPLGFAVFRLPGEWLGPSGVARLLLDDAWTLDALSWESAPAGFAVGRYPDGAASCALLSSTPGKSNVQAVDSAARHAGSAYGPARVAECGACNCDTGACNAGSDVVSN